MARHGKRDDRETTKWWLRMQLKKQANAKPDGASAKELKRQDIENWKKNR